jgi:hypothetical protein
MATRQDGGSVTSVWSRTHWGVLFTGAQDERPALLGDAWHDERSPVSRRPVAPDAVHESSRRPRVLCWATCVVSEADR